MYIIWQRLYIYIYIYIYVYITYGKEIKLSFQVLRVSCKHSFTFLSLIVTEVTFCKKCIDFLLSNTK